MNIQKEKKEFMREFFARGVLKKLNKETGEIKLIPNLIIETESDEGEKIEDYFERKLTEALGEKENRGFFARISNNFVR